MLNGKCPCCNSTEVYKKNNGITSGDKYIYVHGLSMLTPRTQKMTFVCTQCGLYENYILDEAILKKVKDKWEKV